ncbi:MAG: 50S ribosomal protein L11 methyltransferase [Acidiferrobacteraceae bacterium]
MRLRAQGTQAEGFLSALETAGAEAVTVEPATDEPRYHDPAVPVTEDLTGGWRECWVSGLFPGVLTADDVRQRFAGLAPLPAYELRVIKDTDWAAAMRATFVPRHFPPRLWIYPSWCTPPDDGSVHVVLDPGLAFGTGMHATTALCLEWISAATASGPAPESVIDYGCGSGILAIAALRLGAGQGTAIDLDPQALKVASDNARRNGVDDRMHCARPGRALHPADLVFANILAAPLIGLAPVLTAATRQGGSLLLSGFTEDQESAVRAAYPGIAFTPTMREEWVLLAGTRER